MSMCRVNDCDSSIPCDIECCDCGTLYSSDERECPKCYLRTCMQNACQRPTTFNPSTWTGRAPHAGSPIDLLRRWWRYRVVFPWKGECELCVGQEYWQGCYCQYHGCTAPGVPPARWRAWLQNRMEERKC